MSGSFGVWMLVGVAFVMLATGLPAWMSLIGVAGSVAAAGVLSGNLPLEFMSALPARLIGLLESDLLQALPLYVLMGVLLNRLPLAEKLFSCTRKLFEPTGASPSLAGLFLGVFMSPMNGSVGASVSMLAKTLLPRLEGMSGTPQKHAAVICVGSTLGVVIPPSLVLILLADAMLRAHTEAVNATHSSVRIINTQDIFRGALIPASLLVVLVLLIAWFVNRRSDDNQGPSVQSGDWAIAVITSLVILGLLGSVAFGYLYAVEAAATGGMAILLYALVSRFLTREVIGEVLRDTMAITGALFALLVAATTFTMVLRALGTDRWVASWLSIFGDSPMNMLVAVAGILLVSSFVLDAFEMIFVVIPILMPPLLIKIPDATWVAVITLLILQLGFILPPMGYAVLMIGSRLKNAIPISAMTGALLPYVGAQLLVIVLVVIQPQMLWRSNDTIDASLSQEAPLSEDEVRRIFEEQMRENMRVQGEAGLLDGAKSKSE